jgi:Kef-type K+ transport system membrane component KefB
VATLAVAFVLSKSIVPALVSQLRSRFSDELFQLAMIGYCLSCAWICNKLGLSHELGAFLAGIMISTFEHHAAVALSTEQVRLLLLLVGLLAPRAHNGLLDEACGAPASHVL